MKIFVLESLRAGDPKTGDLVHQYLDTKGVENEFHEFKSKQELLDILGAIQIKAAAENFQPFVHFDCHGNDDGIGVVKADNSEELITWNEVRETFRQIYMKSKHKSVICMSSCQGFNVIRLVAQCEPCPYDHVCGSFEKIGFDDSYRAYTDFYTQILGGTSIYDAAVTIHNDPKFKKMKFLGVNSRTLFQMAIDGYIANECTEEKLNEQREKHRTILRQDGPLSRIQEDYLQHAFSLEGQKQILERCAAIFFSLK